jgi:hypothetical protein
MSHEKLDAAVESIDAHTGGHHAFCSEGRPLFVNERFQRRAGEISLRRRCDRLLHKSHQ